MQTVADPTAPLDGGTAVVGLFSDLDGLNEFVSTDAVATEVMEYVLYLPLLRWSETYEIEGALARDWQFSEDRRTVTMQLREDVRWHDGVPTTADDVVFSFDRFRDPALAYADIGSMRFLDSVEKVGPYEVRFRFSRAYANQLADLRRVILPKHLLESIPSAEMESAEFNRKPVGNGPFRFVRWERDQQIVFEANPDFADGRPHLNRVIFRVIPDQTAIETAFLSGEIDVVDRIRYESVESLRRNPAVEIFTREQRGYQYIGWNTRSPFFGSAEERRAMTLAIDRQRIIDALVFGQGKVTAHPMMSLLPFYPNDIKPYPYDPDEARRLLAAAGWKDTDGDGVLDRNGIPFDFELVTNLGNQLREDTLVMVQSDLAKIGVVARPEVREWSVFLDDIKGKRFDADHLAWQTDFIYDPYDLFHSAAIEGKYNMTSFSDSRVDSLIDAGTRAETVEEAAPIWHDLLAVLHEEQPYTILFELLYSSGASRRIRNVDVDVRSFLVSVSDWWIAPKDRKYDR
ncbi:MAG: peptide-binding protein [Gemmatimonadetes bacterium]|nr:peptide-binding protein [Gemmatimonadota bacterium]